MSGIAGIVELQGPSGTASGNGIRKMLSVMQYRGPDGSNVLVRPGSAFGYLALVSTPFHCPQPLQLADHTIVADARLDERERLSRQLGVPEQTSDPELILRAYLRWEEQCVAHLTGDFAFVVSSQAGIFCARDHLGVKPFYYSELDGNFVFASEARPVRAVTRSALNEQRIADFLVYPLEHVDTTSTFYEGVFRLAPASTLTVTSTSSAIYHYWHPCAEQSPLYQSEQACIEAFSEQLEIAVRDRLADHGATAMGLSGGVDSTALIGVALSLGRTVETFSSVSEPETPCLESDFIRKAVAEMDVDATLLGPEAMSGMVDEVYRQLGHMQEPFDYAMIQMMLLYRSGHLAGHKSMIDGVEGDMLYSLSSNYPAMLYREGKILQGIQEALASARVRGHASYPRALWTSIRQLGAPRFLARLKQGVQGNLYQKALDETLISVKFARKTETLLRLEQQAKQLYSGARDTREIHRREVMHPALPVALERYDRVAALSGIEPRHPLVDKRLVELSLLLPAHMKVKKGWSKYILRKVSEGLVPHAIAWRTDKSENSWRCHEVLAAHKAACIETFVRESGDVLSQYVKPEGLGSVSYEDMLPLFGLAKWLQAEHDLLAG
jgi:asparagine synthase (glutamine-hydrolysing)